MHTFYPEDSAFQCTQDLLANVSLNHLGYNKVMYDNEQAFHVKAWYDSVKLKNIMKLNSTIFKRKLQYFMTLL